MQFQKDLDSAKHVNSKVEIVNGGNNNNNNNNNLNSNTPGTGTGTGRRSVAGLDHHRGDYSESLSRQKRQHPNESPNNRLFVALVTLLILIDSE